MFTNISNYSCKCHSFPKMYDMLQAKVDWPGQLISSKNNPKNGLFSKRKCMVYSVLNSPILGLKSHSGWSFDQILAGQKILFLEIPFPNGRYTSQIRNFARYQ